MGIEIDREEFEDADFDRFSERLQQGLAALGELLARPGFGRGPSSVGAELELCLVDATGRPLLRNLDVLAGCSDPRVTIELNRFNMELGTRAHALAGRPFSALGAEFAELLAHIGRAAARHGGRVVAVGILPTLAVADVQSEAMTDLPRFRALSRGIRRLRNARFTVDISGADPLSLEVDDVTCEGANTSLQLHLRVAPADYVDSYNAAQIATAPVLAAAGNSPIFLGHRLWEETRIALFKQAVDERDDVSESWRPARVSFGNGWAREGPLELFAETVALHPPLLPVVSDEDPLARVRAGGTPALSEVRLHHGTVWRWNRSIYDPADGGHLRIELRALPAGPSVLDMQANMAFLAGLALGLRREADWMTAALPFRHAEHNFYRAAQHGLDAMLLWPSRRAPSPQPVRARTLIHRLLPVALQGLADGAVERDEAERLLGVIEERVDSGQTGARWQRAAFEALCERWTREAALAAMLERYLEHSASGAPAHAWPLPRP
jgi:gamma-glutamyl:cysteine ligase YbdK (ATP-grasp superfamily)